MLPQSMLHLRTAITTPETRFESTRTFAGKYLSKEKYLLIWLGKVLLNRWSCQIHLSPPECDLVTRKDHGNATN
jgi:hypothetical protein